MESTKRSLFLRSLDAGGIPALCAISLALSRRSPSLTAENSGFMKNSTLSKYSHCVCVISTTCLLTPFINLISPFTPLDFYVIFGRMNGRYTYDFVRLCNAEYTICITDFSTEKVDNCVEKLNNYAENPLFFTENGCGKLYYSNKEYTKGCSFLTKCCNLSRKLC